MGTVDVTRSAVFSNNFDELLIGFSLYFSSFNALFIEVLSIAIDAFGGSGGPISMDLKFPFILDPLVLLLMTSLSSEFSIDTRSKYVVDDLEVVATWFKESGGVWRDILVATVVNRVMLDLGGGMGFFFLIELDTHSFVLFL